MRWSYKEPKRKGEHDGFCLLLDDLNYSKKSQVEKSLDELIRENKREPLTIRRIELLKKDLLES
jgi:hypothetical protein